MLFKLLFYFIIKSKLHVRLCYLSCWFISYSSLEKKSLLRDNVDLLVSLADVYFRAGDTKNAILKFEQAQMLDPYLIKGGQYTVYCVQKRPVDKCMVCKG